MSQLKSNFPFEDDYFFQNNVAPLFILNTNLIILNVNIKLLELLKKDKKVFIGNSIKETFELQYEVLQNELQLLVSKKNDFFFYRYYF